MKTKSKKLAYLEGIVSIFLNIILFALKYWVGIVTGSISIIADAWHTLSDSLTSIVVIIGAKVSSKPPDKEHPFGHGRAESIASIIIGVLLFTVGSNFLLDAIQKLKSKEAAMFTTASIIIFIFSVIVKEAMAQFSFWAYRKTKIHSLKADGWHHRSDSIASAIILISMLFGKNIWWVDGVFGVVVSILIIYTAIDIIKEAAQPILGDRPDPKDIELIHQIGSACKLNNIHKIQKHNYGSHCEYTMHAHLSKYHIVQSAHLIIETFRKELRDKMDIEATIYIEPE